MFENLLDELIGCETARRGLELRCSQLREQLRLIVGRPQRKVGRPKKLAEAAQAAIAEAPTQPKRKLSARGRAAIVKATKAMWARKRAAEKVLNTPKKRTPAEQRAISKRVKLMNDARLKKATAKTRSAAA